MSAIKVRLRLNIQRMVVQQVARPTVSMISVEQKGIVIMKKQEAIKDIASVMADTILIIVILIQELVFNDR